MVRKTKEESDKTRLSILNTALTIFFEKGYARTTLDDIANACGITRGAIYWHFKDKTDLFLTLARQIDEEAGINYYKLLSERNYNLENLIIGIGDYFCQLEENEKYWKLYCLIYHKTEWTEELEPLIVQYRKEIRGLLSVLGQALEKLKVEKALKDNIDTEEIALATWALMEGLIGMWFFDPDLFSLKQTGTKLVGDYLRQFRRK
jgi:TetR/AcrR family transcriptional regulator, acrAB operon repressor